MTDAAVLGTTGDFFLRDDLVGEETVLVDVVEVTMGEVAGMAMGEVFRLDGP